MKLIISTLFLSLSLFSINAFAHATYGAKYCNQPGYHCLKVQRGDTWESLFVDPRERLVVKKLNRMNVPLKPRYVIAVPNDLRSIDYMDVAPFPRHLAEGGKPIVKVDLSELAWGAYDADGRLVNWGPVSGGQNYCSDVGRGCNTVTGEYQFYRKQGYGCISSKYPRPRGGAPMPYCMHFKGGYAVHASNEVPGHHASHGCVRVFLEDAKWLNHNFVRIGTRIKITR